MTPRQRVDQVLVVAVIFGYQFVVGIPLVAELVFSILMLEPGCKRRFRARRWIIVWSARLYRLVALYLNMDLQTDPQPADYRAAVRKIKLVIAPNHQSSADIVMHACMLHWVGYQNVTWVVKRWIVIKGYKIPFALMYPMGWALYFAGAAFVSRAGDGRDDLKRLKKCFALARLDGASVMIYVEGTRRRPSNLSDNYRYVIEPDSGAFRQAVKHLSNDYHVLFPVTCYEVEPTPLKITDFWRLRDCRIKISLNSYKVPTAGQARNGWLIENWKIVDQIMGTLRRGFYAVART